MQPSSKREKRFWTKFQVQHERKYDTLQSLLTDVCTNTDFEIKGLLENQENPIHVVNLSRPSAKQLKEIVHDSLYLNKLNNILFEPVSPHNIEDYLDILLNLEAKSIDLNDSVNNSNINTLKKDVLSFLEKKLPTQRQ